ncbi:MAG: SLC13 family permease [Eubacteriales bacterium]
MNTEMTIAIIICILTIASYVWGKITLCITAMTSVALFLLFGLVSGNDVLGNIGNNNVVMILSMFVVAAGFNKTKFVSTLADSLNKVAKGSLTLLLTGYGLITILLSQFILSPATVLSILGPLLITSAKGMNVSPSKVVMPVAMSSIITTGALPIGSGATVSAELTAYLGTGGYTATTMGLLDPMIGRLPIVIVVAIYCIFFAHKFAPDEPLLELGDSEQRKAGGPPPKALNQTQEVLGYVIFFGTTLAIIFSSKVGQPAWIITLVGAVLMCITGVLSEREAITAVPWWMGGLSHYPSYLRLRIPPHPPRGNTHKPLSHYG